MSWNNFLDVMLIRTNDTLQTTIFRQSTHNGVYIHWSSFAPRTWKRATLQGTEELLLDELKQIEEQFININGYPKWVFDQVNEECKAPRNPDYDNNVTVNNEIIITTHRLILPYKGEQGQNIIKSLNNYVERLLPQNQTAQHLYISRKLVSAFDIKDRTKLIHKHDLTYLVIFPENTCSEVYLAKATTRLNERIMEHASKGNKSHMLKHTLQYLVIHQFLKTILEYFRKNITTTK